MSDDILFPPFRLDLVNEQLWREDQLVPLRPKTFAVLRCLVEQAGRLVTKEELLKSVWPDIRVSAGILKVYIRGVRDALGDDPQQPQFIETVPRRGHRFIGQVVSNRISVKGKEEAFSPAPSTQHPAPALVGRGTELAHLLSLFEKAMSGERQMVFVTGEPGIGKTTLVETFIAGLRNWELGSRSSSPQSPNPQAQILSPSPWFGRGQCVEQHGAGEAYLPVLEALGRIGRSAGGEQLMTVLQQYAPTWLVQMPALVTAAELEGLQRRVMGASRERMLREMVEAIEVLTAQRPLVLWFEDLHWADASTVDWLAAVAQQPAAARLLVIGTYRPSDLSVSNHPLRALKQELVAKGQSEELLLPYLSADNIMQYLTRRYPRHRFPPALAIAIHRSTNGNPLFVANMMEYWAAQGVIAEVDGHWHLQSPIEEVARGVPESVRQLIEKQVERLNEEQQQLLAVASIAGVTFSASAVAVGLEVPVEKVEKWSDGLVTRGQFLQTQEAQVLPDGTLCGSYGFQHALQHAVVYERIPQLRRLRLHRRIGESQERQYGEHVNLIAAELAMHFERGQVYHKAAQYHHQAGMAALRRYANREAIAHFTQGIALLASLPETPERWHQELQLQAALIGPIIMTAGYSAPALEQACARARLLCQQLSTPLSLFMVLCGLHSFYMIRGQLQAASEMSTQLVQMVETAADPVSILLAFGASGGYSVYHGAFAEAQPYLRRCLALYNSKQHGQLAFQVGHDPGVMNLDFLAWSLWFLGYPDQAMVKLDESQTLAQELQIPPITGGQLHSEMCLFYLSRQPDKILEHRKQILHLTDEMGASLWGPAIQILHGWALTQTGQANEGIAHAEQGLQHLQVLGVRLWLPEKLATLADAYLTVGRHEEGYRAVSEGLAVADQSDAHWFDAELYRLKGELLLAQASKSQKSKIKREREVGDLRRETSPPFPPAPSLQPPVSEEVWQEAETDFLKAINIARQQQAKSLELRVLMSLVRLRQQQMHHAPRTTHHAPRRRLAEAHKMLSDVYNWFTEGFDTKDLQEARALLESLG